MYQISGRGPADFTVVQQKVRSSIRIEKLNSSLPKKQDFKKRVVKSGKHVLEKIAKQHFQEFGGLMILSDSFTRDDIRGILPGRRRKIDWTVVFVVQGSLLG